VLDQDRVPALNELFEKIDEVTSKELQNVANEIFEEDKLSFLFMEPVVK
jgi:predicted Zn-dependent peptidase